MTRDNLLLAAATVMALLVIAPAALADRIVTNDGKVYEGRATVTPDHVIIETADGVFSFPRSSLKEITHGQYTQPAETQPAADTTVTGPLPITVHTEPIIFTLMRRLRTAEPGEQTIAIRKQLQQWQFTQHDGSLKTETGWVKAEELQRRRGVFGQFNDQVVQLLSDAERMRPRDATQKARQAQLTAQAYGLMSKAAGAWGDPTIRSFLLGQVAIIENNEMKAHRLFNACVKQLPFVPGFHQGRAMAYDLIGRPLDALDDYRMCFELHDDSPEAYFDLLDAMERVPGQQIVNPLYKRAKELADRYAEPDRRPRTTDRYGPRWIMPGGPWQARNKALFAPTVDYYLPTKVLAVPVAAKGVLLVDAAAIDKAADMYLEVAPGQYTRAYPTRIRISSRNAVEVPVAVIQVVGFSFTPVGLADLTAIKPDTELTLTAHTLPADLDTDGPRKRKVKVATYDEGKLALSEGLLPGESAGAVFDADGKLVTFLPSRADPQAINGGPDVVTPPADVAKFVEYVLKATERSSSGPRRARGAPTLVGDPIEAKGNTFTLHILTGVGGPPK